MEPLSATHQERLVDECERLMCERQQIAAVLGSLPGTVAELRVALNRFPKQSRVGHVAPLGAGGR